MYVRRTDIKPFDKKVWLASPTMHGDELKYITEAYDSNWMSTVGANINEVEHIAAQKAEMKYAVALSSCTAALHLCVRAAGERLYGRPAIGHGAVEGRRVFCSDMTFAATLNPVVYEGGIPVFIDTERDTWNMNPRALERAFEIYPEVQLVVAAHLYGFPGKADEIRAVCDAHGALLIEDAAESMGATYKGRQTGSFGDYAAISYNGNKIITGSSGGCLLTNDLEVANKARKWSKQARENTPWYLYKENGGMHTAHNAAYANIDTELNVCIDSDDALADGAVRCIVDLWEKTDRRKYAGIIGLDADMNTGKVIGTGFPEDMKETTLAGFYDAGGSGDKKLVYRTDIMKELPPYPVFEGEKYVSLGWKYQLCDQKYKLVTTNTVLCNVEYQPDGSSRNMLRQYLRNPQGFAFIRKENLKYIKDWKRNVTDVIHYCSSSQISGNPHYVRESPRPFLTALCIPAGRLLTAYIRKKARTEG